MKNKKMMLLLCMLISSLGIQASIASEFLAGLVVGSTVSYVTYLSTASAPNEVIIRNRKTSEAKPSIDVCVHHYVGSTSSLIRGGRNIDGNTSFYLDSYSLKNDTPIVVEDEKGNFVATNLGQFDGKEDSFLTQCSRGYSRFEGEYIDGYVIQPLGEGRHFDINDKEICKCPKVKKALAEFYARRDNKNQ